MNLHMTERIDRHKSNVQTQMKSKKKMGNKQKNRPIVDGFAPEFTTRLVRTGSDTTTN